MKNYLVYDIGGTFVKWAIITEDNKIIKKGKFESTSDDGNVYGQEILKRISNNFKDIDENIESIGISTCGIIDNVNGTVITSGPNIKEYKGLNIKKILEEETKLKVAVENDGNCAALGELENGAIKGKNNINAALIVIGTGVGCGLLINGQPYTGTNYYAGEIGRILIEGKRWELDAAAKSITDKASEILGRDIDGVELFNTYKTNDKLLKLINDFIETTAIGMMNILLLLDLESFILSGGVVSNDTFPVEEILNKIKELTPDFLGVKANILKSKLGNDANLFGAKRICSQL